jgi:3-phytase
MKQSLLFFFLLLVSCSSELKVTPRFATASVPGDADDCAIWINFSDPHRSAIIGNDKASNGRLYVWDLRGNLRYQTDLIDSPSNLDLRYGMKINGQTFDILACVVRGTNCIKVFRIHPDTYALEEITADGGIPTGFSQDPYGLALYKRPSDSFFYVFVSQKKKGADLHQIKLEDNGQGKIKGTIVSQFGGKDQKNLIEGMCVDDDLGFLYCSDESHAVLKYEASPDRSKDLLYAFAKDDGIQGDREGLALYSCPDGKGYLLLSSQGNSTLKVYDREGDNRFITTINKQDSFDTDGIEATSCQIPGLFKYGFVVCHNSKGKNFVIYDWQSIAGKKLLTSQCPYQ